MTAVARRGRWIEHWEPDDETFWAHMGEKIARKNLVLSMFAEHIGFSIWVLWTIVVLNLANIAFFYPEHKKGVALGLNAAGGNLGVAVAQLIVPLVIIVGIPAAAVKLPKHHVHMAYAGLVWLPFIAVASLAAWLYMDSLT